MIDILFITSDFFKYSFIYFKPFISKVVTTKDELVLILAVIENKTKGNELFTWYQPLCERKYFSNSVWKKRLKEKNMFSYDVAASYGVFCIPYGFAFSKGFEGHASELYKPEVAFKYLKDYIQFIRNTYDSLSRQIQYYGYFYKDLPENIEYRVSFNKELTCVEDIRNHIYEKE